METQVKDQALALHLQWEIHQDLPYGTMADDEMRKMNIGVLQDDGVIFLWVTGKDQTFTK